jgi:hypothetical protein
MNSASPAGNATANHVTASPESNAMVPKSYDSANSAQRVGMRRVVSSPSFHDKVCDLIIYLLIYLFIYFNLFILYYS